MGGELNRINPTVVEGAEDIMGAEDASFKADTFKFNWNERNQNPRNRPARRMTEKQFSDLQRMQRMGRSMGFRAEGMGQKMSQGQFEALRRMVRQQQSGRNVIRGDMSRMLRRDLRRAEYLGDMAYMQGRILEEERRKNRDAKDSEQLGAESEYEYWCSYCGDSGPKTSSPQWCKTYERNGGSGYHSQMCGTCYDTHEGLCYYCESGDDYRAESFEANETDANMVSEGSVDAFYGGGAKVSVSSAGIQPTANPSVEVNYGSEETSLGLIGEGNDFGQMEAEGDYVVAKRPYHMARVRKDRAVYDPQWDKPNMHTSMNQSGKMYDEESGSWIDMNFDDGDVVDLTQELASKVGFRLGGMSASALVLGVAALAGYRFAKR